MFAALALAALTASTTLSPAIAPEAAPTAEGLRASGGYLHVSPGVGAWSFGAPVLGYAWGVGGGYHLARGRRFAAQFGGYFQHIAWDSRAGVHDVRVGPELRVGGSRPGVFGYGLARAGLDLLVDASSKVFSRAMVSVGAGVQGALGPRRRLLIGFEPSATMALPGGGVVVTLEARLLLGWRF